VTPKPRRPVLPFRPDDLKAVVKPLIKPIIKPVVEPVLSRLDRHEQLLEEVKAALEIQFKRTAAIQAQLDHLISTLSRRP
jgi:hypothetical protein